MRLAVFDLEGNGLLNCINSQDNADRVWCGVFKTHKEVMKFGGIGRISYMFNYMSRCTHLIGHNIIDYDLPLLKRLYNFELSPKTVVLDTYLLSQMLWPDLKKHPDCKKGPHSLENWGCIFGRAKPEHEEWDRYSPEMLHRCTEDVEINWLLWEKIREEAWPNDFKLDGGLQD